MLHLTDNRVFIRRFYRPSAAFTVLSRHPPLFPPKSGLLSRLFRLLCRYDDNFQFKSKTTNDKHAYLDGALKRSECDI